MSGLCFQYRGQRKRKSRFNGHLNKPPRRAPGREGEKVMNITAVLKVFKGSSLITERGEFKISRVFSDGKAANKARYYYYCDEGSVIIYARRGRAGKRIFAAADK
jgi:hypothetical protein